MTKGPSPALEHSFAGIVDATQQSLFRVAARLLGDEAEAADVVQDSYLRAYQAMVNGRFDGRSTVKTWLYRITVNTALDALRARRRRRPLVQAVEPAEPRGDLQAEMDQRAALRELAALLCGLPPEQRAALVLKDVEGLSSAEIAKILQCSEGAVEQRLVRARASLRESQAT